MTLKAPETSKNVKLKKYLFLVSIIFLLSSFWSLLYSYLYSDSKLIAVKWWSISEAIIWDFPHLNPLKQSSWNDKYIIWLLYRSLLTYDIEKRKIVSDLASCDISNLLYIECYLEDNIKWSNWEKIWTKDIITTFDIVKNSNINPVMSSILKNTIIEEGAFKLIFINTKKDISFLNILFQPIIPETIANKLWEEELKSNFSPLNWIYSWKYIINSINQDSSLWITNIVLERNKFYYKNDILINKLILKIFADNSHFLKFKDSINLFNDKDNLIWNSVPRLKSSKYTLPQYVWIFLNYKSIKNKELRNFILNEIDREELIKILWENKFKKVINPYLTDISIDGDNDNKSSKDILKEIWYFKKYDLIDSQKNEYKIEDEKLKRENKEKSKLIVFPLNTNKYNFISKGDILLKWETNDFVDAVYINDYKLKNFKKWWKDFYYRLRESYETIKKWKNTYKIYFEKEGKKELKEEIVFVYNTDTNKLQEEKEKFEKEEEKRLLKEDLDRIKERENYIKDLENLEENFFYNEYLEKLSFNLAYIGSEKKIEKTANYIKKVFQYKGINLNLTNISAENKLLSFLNNWDYDMILIWINLWYFDFNISHYFHSGQAENAYNFSNFKKLSLDILLEELKWNKLSRTKILELEEKILDILKQEHIVKTFYTPILNQLVDKNIKNYKLPEFIPEKSLRGKALAKSYTSERKIINFENKEILGFFKFLLGIISE